LALLHNIWYPRTLEMYCCGELQNALGFGRLGRGDRILCFYKSLLVSSIMESCCLVNKDFGAFLIALALLLGRLSEQAQGYVLTHLYSHLTFYRCRQQNRPYCLCESSNLASSLMFHS
jgi:hypothetical protein